MPLIEEAHKAARILLDHAYVRIVARAEPDAACAAALLAHALRRESVDFHVSWARRLDGTTLAAIAQERPDCAVVIGLSGDAEAAEVPAARTLLLDAAPPTIAADALVHADASLAGLAHLVAAGISKRNVDLAPLALAGALASWRHIGGWKGLDAEILRDAVESGVVLREAALALHGPGLLQALTQLDAPYVAGLTGRARNAKKLVTDLKLRPDALPASLAAEESQRLGDLLALRLLQQGAPDAALDALFRPTLRGLAGPHTGLECGELARAAEAACSAGRAGLAFAALWPDGAAGGELVDMATAAREQMVQALVAAERDAKREGRLLVATAPHATMCRPLADRIALAHAHTDTIVVVHAEDVVTLRSWAGDAHPIAQRAAPLAGATAGGAGGMAHLWAPDATRALKALVEASS
ncbi:MAG TPA: hypothetical protein VM370_01670 [Candidatus Thermoplasmatota archaeon]|nr:hypothetical protein [Candidatus Thermoplasmatota archaeon]